MTFSRRFGFAVLAVLAAIAVAWAAPSAVRGQGEAARAPADVHARLLADVSAIEPGKPFRIGVLLTLPQGWHVYWQNPGEAGLATAVRFAAPPGFTVGELEWPVPEHFTQPGDVAGYGYAGEVLLTAEVRPPRAFPDAAQVTLRASVTWLGCHTACVPGSADLSLVLTLAARADAANAALFGRWLSRVPASGASADAPGEAAIRVEGDMTADTPQVRVTMDVRWKAEVRDVAWFPAAPDAVKLADVAVSHDAAARSTRITFTARLLRGQTLKEPVMDTVVAFTDAAGTRRGLQAPVRLRGPAPATGFASGSVLNP
jgi:thiol:disulfide interchange protein DsbD